MAPPRPLHKGLAALFLLVRLPALSSALQQMPNSTNGNNNPLIIVNNCPNTIWPGIGTQHGVGPGTGGFALAPQAWWGGWNSWDWQGRVWGRTNCSFNANGTGPGNLNGVNGNGAACLTGDCMGVLDCQFTVSDIHSCRDAF
jgi:hypothetical protein